MSRPTYSLGTYLPTLAMHLQTNTVGLHARVPSPAADAGLRGNLPFKGKVHST